MENFAKFDTITFKLMRLSVMPLRKTLPLCNRSVSRQAADVEATGRRHGRFVRREEFRVLNFTGMSAARSDSRLYVRLVFGTNFALMWEIAKLERSTLQVVESTSTINVATIFVHQQ